MVLIREVVGVLRDAGGPLPRTEVAKRANLTLHAASYRLQTALKLKFVERTGHGMYRATVAVTPIAAV